MDFKSNYGSAKYDAVPDIQPVTNHATSMPALRIAKAPALNAPAKSLNAPAITLVDPSFTAANMFQAVTMENQAVLRRYLKLTKIRRESIVKFEFIYNGYTALINPCETVQGDLVGRVGLFAGCVRDRFTLLQLENGESFA